ncbi:MAG: hypothetical protein OEZ01_08715 [Candidatus Heimdallarchaeota archaeon]|nr:hypothetical protein [Candidatus Heimdallarchaeota archaeon]MDH5646076.1 hypothetical protein [Candidatus Heimdallarchaeota archaeon]
MPGLLEDNSKISSQDRLFTVICLIMLIEHKELGFEELIKITGLTFTDIRQSIQNLINLRLIEVIPNNLKVPKFKIINEQESKQFLETTGIDFSDTKSVN